MLLLLCGCLLFFGTHSLSIIRPQLRTTFVARYGANAWQGIYSLIAAAGLGLMIYGYGAARESSAWLFAPPAWSRHAAMTLMLPVFILIAAAYIPGRIKTAVRHPMLAGTVLWAASHLPANGRIADIVFFGSFLAWALADLLSMTWRNERPNRRLPAGKYNDVAAIMIGLAAYVLMLFAHGAVTGIALVGR